MSLIVSDEPEVIIVESESLSFSEVDVFSGLTINTSGASSADTLNLSPPIAGYGTTVQSAIEELVDTWIPITTNVVATKNSQYIAVNNTLSPLQIIIPTSAPLGFEFSVLGSLGTYQITQNPGQQIQFGNVLTTNGSSGGIYSSTEGDYLRLVCIQSPNKWAVISAIGNLTFF